MSVRKYILLVLLLLLAAPSLLPLWGSAIGSAAERGMAAPADTVNSDKPRYSVRKTGAEDAKSVRKKSADLRDPDNLNTEVIYDEKDNTYTIGT